MKTHILLAGLACLSVVAVAQQSSSSDQKTNKPKVQVRESPSKASLGRRESPTKRADGVAAADVNGDGKDDKAPIGSQSSGSGPGVAINNSHSNIKSPRDSATGQASGKVNVQDLSVMKTSSAPADTKSPRDSATGQASGKVNVQDLSVMKKSSAPADTDKK
jgi:hypothetical protein